MTPAVTDAAAEAALAAVFAGGRPVLVHLHGNNMAPGQCFERCARFEELFGVAVVGFSWPSEGTLPSGKRRKGVTGARAEAEDRWTLAAVNATTSPPRGGTIADVIARYRQSKCNGKSSAAALARFLERVGKAQAIAHTPQPFSIAAHSLGVHCLQMLLEAGLGRIACRRRATSPCWRPACRSASTSNGSPSCREATRLMITTNISDWVLLGALWADKFAGQARRFGSGAAAGRRPQDALRRLLRRCSFGEHEYFIAEQGDTLDLDLLALFTRFFGSADDIPGGSDPCHVYGRLLRRRSAGLHDLIDWSGRADVTAAPRDRAGRARASRRSSE